MSVITNSRLSTGGPARLVATVIFIAIAAAVTSRWSPQLGATQVALRSIIAALILIGGYEGLAAVLSWVFRTITRSRFQARSWPGIATRVSAILVYAVPFAFLILLGDAHFGAARAFADAAVVSLLFFGGYEGIAYVVSGLLRSPESRREIASHAPARPFGISDALIVLGLTMLAILAAGFVEGIVTVLQLGPAQSTAKVQSAIKGLGAVNLVMVYCVGALVLARALRRYSRRTDWPEISRLCALSIGTAPPFLKAAFLGAVLAVLYMVIGPHLLDPHSVTHSPYLTTISRTPADRALVTLAVALMAPPVEELLFRGLIMGSMVNRLGTVAAAIISGTAFWLLHLQESLKWWPAAVSIALMTALCTVLRIRMRSLGPSIGTHMAYNAVIVLFGVLARGHF